MTSLDQGADRTVNAVLILRHHTVKARIVQFSVQKNHRNRSLGKAPKLNQSLLAMLRHRGDHDPSQPMLPHTPEDLLLLLHALICVVKEYLIAMLLCKKGHTLKDLGKEGIVYIRHYHTDGHGLRGAETSGRAVGDIVQQLDRIHDPLSAFLTDGCTVVHNSGNRRNGDTCLLGNFVNVRFLLAHKISTCFRKM
jgi:hypothetical protein